MISKPTSWKRAASWVAAGLSVSVTVMKTVPCDGSATPAAACALPKAAGKSAAMPITSPVDFIRERKVDLVINTPTGSGARTDGYEIRTAATRQGIPCITTMTGASAAARAISAQKEAEAPVQSLQELHRSAAASSATAQPREGR